MVKTFYLDDDNNFVSKEEATHFIVQEYDENDNLVKETYGFTKKPWEMQDYNKVVEEPSEEIKNVLDNVKDKDGNYLFRK